MIVLQVQQFASLFNLTSIALVLVVAWIVQRSYPSPFFREWTRAYGLGLVFLASDLVVAFLGRSLPLTLVQVLLLVSAAWFFIRTSLVLQERRVPSGYFWLALGVGGAMAAGLSVLAAPATAALLLPGAAFCVAHIWLGWVLLSRRLPTGARAPWVGWPMAMLGAWLFTYPLLERTPLFWAGYYVSGLLQLLVGIGMVVFLLEESAHRLRVQNAKLEQLDRMKTNFLNTVSHELRTPLTGIVGNLELLEDGVVGPLTPEQESVLRGLRGGSDSLMDLVNSLLDAAQIEAGALKVHVQPMELQPIIEQVIQLWVPAANAKEIRLIATLPPALPRVLADPQRVTQVLSNLISNAIKFTERGGEVRVEVTLDAHQLDLHVSDTGIGIPEDILPRIFDRFYQVDSSTTRRYGGTGLGLTIAKTLLGAMGGDICVRSHEGQGTTFTCTLPIAQSPVIHLDPETCTTTIPQDPPSGPERLTAQD